MSNAMTFRRTMAVVLSGAVALSLVQPVVAAPLPVAKQVGAHSQVESVQFRRGRPVAGIKRKRSGNGAATAAAIIGAVAIGAAAVAASNSEKRRQRRAEREAYYYGGNPYGYAPAQPYYAPAPTQYYGGGYYQQPVQPGYRQYRAPSIDGGSPYAIQQQRVRQRSVQPYQPDYSNVPRGRYILQPDGSARPVVGPYQLNAPPIIPAPRAAPQTDPGYFPG